MRKLHSLLPVAALSCCIVGAPVQAVTIVDWDAPLVSSSFGSSPAGMKGVRSSSMPSWRHPLRPPFACAASSARLAAAG